MFKIDLELQNPQGGPAGGESPLWHAHQAEEESLQGMLTRCPLFARWMNLLGLDKIIMGVAQVELGIHGRVLNHGAQFKNFMIDCWY